SSWAGRPRRSSSRPRDATSHCGAPSRGAPLFVFGDRARGVPPLAGGLVRPGVAELSTRSLEPAPRASARAGPALAREPAVLVEGDVAGGGEGDALLLEQAALDGAADGVVDGDLAEVTGVLADDALPRQRVAARGAHGGADGAGGARVAGELGDLAVGGDPA